MTRRCKNGCWAELPPASKCTDILQKKGFCSYECLIQHGRKKAKDKAAKEKAKEQEWVDDFRRDIATPAKAKERIRSRTEWLSILQDLVNQYVLHIRDKDEPCCTCGTTNQYIKYDAGHCFTRGARPELRFEETNIHRQCSSDCNVHHSGRQAEHKEFIRKKYGADHLAKLEDRTQWPSLKDTFPDNESIKKEILRYRKLIRDNGLRPRR